MEIASLAMSAFVAHVTPTGATGAVVPSLVVTGNVPDHSASSGQIPIDLIAVTLKKIIAPRTNVPDGLPGSHLGLAQQIARYRRTRTVQQK